MPRNLVLLLALTALWYTGTAASGEIFIWTADDGAIVISETAPPQYPADLQVMKTAACAAKRAPGTKGSELAAAVRRIEGVTVDDLERMDHQQIERFLTVELKRHCNHIMGAADMDQVKQQALMAKCGLLQKWAAGRFFFEPDAAGGGEGSSSDARNRPAAQGGAGRTPQGFKQ